LPVILATWEAVIGGSQSEVGQGKSMGFYLKTKTKRTGSVTQMVECLCNKLEVMRLILSTIKKKAIFIE
jgi:hypothetical protein